MCQNPPKSCKLELLIIATDVPIVRSSNIKSNFRGSEETGKRGFPAPSERNIGIAPKSLTNKCPHTKSFEVCPRFRAALLVYLQIALARGMMVKLALAKLIALKSMGQSHEEESD